MILRVFADARGNVIVATGDWENKSAGPPGYYWRHYWSEGMFKIHEDEMTPISCPYDIYVGVAATDGAGRTWVLYGRGEDELVKMATAWKREGEEASGFVDELGSAVPGQIGRGTSDWKLGYMSDSALVEYPGLIDRIPGRAGAMYSDGRSRVYINSMKDIGASTYVYALSWWEGAEPIEIYTLVFGRSFPDAELLQTYLLGPDGLVYILAEYSPDGESRESGVLCLNPDTQEILVFDASTSPFLDCQILTFYVDERNMKWFGTENGLVLFDGQKWSRFDTANTDLPYDEVWEVRHDEIDDAYYVVCQAHVFWTDATIATVVLGSDGRLRGGPIYCGPPGFQYPYRAKLISRDGLGAWWFSSSDRTVVYRYDHEQLQVFNTRDWVEDSYGGSYISSTATGRGFCLGGCLGGSWIMIW